MFASFRLAWCECDKLCAIQVGVSLYLMSSFQFLNVVMFVINRFHAKAENVIIVSVLHSYFEYVPL